MRRSRFVLLVFCVVLSASVVGQQPPPLPPEVGNAVVLATNSARVDRNSVVTRGDLVVNDAGPEGALELSVHQSVRTPAGFALKADGVEIDRNAVIGGDVHSNVLQNDGTILGAQITPLALPVIGMLPGQPDRPAGEEDIIVADGTQRILGRGNYRALVLGIDARLRLPGGPYTFTSITAAQGATIIWDGPGDVIVKERIRTDSAFTVTAGPGINTKRKMFFVRGADGVDELLQPIHAVSIGANSSVSATVHAPNGTIDAGQGLTLVGSFVARDIVVGRDSSLTLRSGFRNLPPVGVNQNIRTNGTQPVVITLSGFDPDADPLTFTIGLQPTQGTLSPITQTGPTTAVVTYTPRTEDPNDVFTFRVTDTEGFFAQGVITINEGQLPAPPTTITAQDAQVEVPPGRPSMITLNAIGPPGVQITISIVPDSGPSNGTLGPLQQPSMNPPRAASVVYVPNQGYLGEDGFRFRACGVISGEQVCDEATISIAVEGPEPPPELAPNLTATANGTTPLSITLGNGTQPPSGPGSSIIAPATAAGAVGDANGDGLGDSRTLAPRVAAGIGQPAGTVRTHFEFNIANLAEVASDIESATVLLRTHRSPTDTMPTAFFFLGSNGDGQLSPSDFEREGEPIRNGVMAVPLNQPVGADGSFSFDILPHLQQALQAGFTHIAIQGRVNETAEAEGPENGLHVYTNDPNNPPQVRPQLGIGIRGEQTARVYRVTSLPAQGTLAASDGTVITSVPYVLPSPVVVYRASSGFAGQVMFSYDVTQENVFDTGTVTITVIGGDGDGR